MPCPPASACLGGVSGPSSCDNPRDQAARRPMRYGFYLPTRGATATRQGVLALAREGERLGLHSAMIADHIVFPTESESVYPYTVDRKHPGGGDALETFSILG